MLLAGGKSGLVRLSDSLKTTLELSEASTTKLLQLAEPYQPIYREIRRLSRDQLAGKLDLEEADRRTGEAIQRIPEEIGLKIAYLAAHEIHSLSLGAVLLACFCLESYVNTLAYFLFNEVDLLGLVRAGNRSSAEVLIDAIARMSIREKWRTIGRLKHATGFDQSRAPFQDFHILFRFRDDQVHDKVVEWSPEESSRRYNGKFPEEDLEPLDLGHALFAAHTYWGMVQEIHKLTGVSEADFHRQYNVSPWQNKSRRKELTRTAKKYREIQS